MKGENAMAALTKAYKEWSHRAKIRQVEIGVGNKQLAEELGYSRQYITNVVNGKREAPVVIARISKRLDIEKPLYT